MMLRFGMGFCSERAPREEADDELVYRRMIEYGMRAMCDGQHGKYR